MCNGPVVGKLEMEPGIGLKMWLGLVTGAILGHVKEFEF